MANLSSQPLADAERIDYGTPQNATDTAIANLTVRVKAYTQPDPELSGHYVRVRPSGTKTFVVVARSPSGRQVWHTIGATSIYSVGA